MPCVATALRVGASRNVRRDAAFLPNPCLGAGRLPLRRWMMLSWAHVESHNSITTTALISVRRAASDVLRIRGAPPDSPARVRGQKFARGGP
jgi:hypothetical protein